MSNYVISTEQTTVFNNLVKSIGTLLKTRKTEAIDVVSEKFYLYATGEWTIFSGKNATHPAPFSLELLFTEFACHKMGGINLNLVSIKNQEKFDQLFSEFIEFLKIDEEYLKELCHLWID